MPEQSLRDKAYRAILQWLDSGLLAKGSITSEAQLCTMLDMSRTPLRSALQQLEQEGFLSIVPKHGILILASSAQRVSDLLEALFSFMLFAYERHSPARDGKAARWGAEQHAAFRQLLEQYEPSAHPRLYSEFELNALLGAIKLCHNDELVRQAELAAGKLSWRLNERRWKPPHLLDAVASLDKLLSTMAGQDADAFRNAMLDSLHLLKLTWT